MRFLFLSQYWAPEVGGAQANLSAIVRELVRRGHEVEVVTALPNYPKGRIFEGYRGRLYVRENREGARIHRLWLYPAMGGGPARMANYASFALSSLAGLARVERPDWVFVESPSLLLGLPAWILGRLHGCPFVFDVGDLWPDSIREMGLLRPGPVLAALEALEAWTYRKARFVLAATEGIHRALVERKGVPREKVIFFPSGVDTGRFRPLPRDPEWVRRIDPGDRKVVLYAGNLGFAQGLETVLEAMGLLRDRKDLLLVMVGDGSASGALQDRARALGLDNVRFLPPVPEEEVPRLASLAFLGYAGLRDLPLFEGARPCKVVAYMACGLPVIFSGRGEVPRMLDRSGAGVAVPPEDPGALARALVEAAEHPEAWARRGEAARAWVEDRLSWEALVTRWLDCLEGRRPPPGPEDPGRE
ncbi:glycosyltransferase family 4 protein [Myxococcota bacterium]|nr:glycosyltransferase family 4 protein [Myxococcota bacterium]